MTKFSIIVPCYNAEGTIASTLDSFRAQTHADWEAVVVDDGSSDASCKIVQEYAQRDDRIRLIFNLRKGPSAARNYGAMTVTRNELIAFCDADDIWTETKLETLAKAFSNPETHGAFGQIAFFNETPSDASVYSTVPQAQLNIDMLLGENPVCTCSNITMRRDAFRATGGFSTEMVHNEDLDWLVRAVGQGLRIQGLHELHTYYRTSPRGLSSELAAMERSRQEVLKTAASFGATPSPTSNAIYNRYLSRRALRMSEDRFLPLRFALAGLQISPSGFFSSPRRGVLTLLAALSVPVLPRPIARRLFT
ncbi:glycosyltransferase family 2 protein [Aliiroseovarius sp. F20344]|uniref:glycosyltransferase family 2 protein n=1 Tax=Aliiroseovarius sp. F20344 TaxID=2926414 RepID=UPI001FF5CE6A|nr:glycosyltransferase family 2 protein [Aliiroseovarius sp. F20344]MCK0142831.1 glycosyltransferase [Aliiroseovarius sp. F20344]